MRKKLLIFGSAILLSSSLYAQYAEDALRFSRSFQGGTARMMGMAGAQQALGADISSLVGNPAGLGFYRKNDFSISPTLRMNNVESKAFGTLSSEQRDQLNIGSLGGNTAEIRVYDDKGQLVTNDYWDNLAAGFKASIIVTKE